MIDLRNETKSIQRFFLIQSIPIGTDSTLAPRFETQNKALQIGNFIGHFIEKINNIR